MVESVSALDFFRDDIIELLALPYSCEKYPHRLTKFRSIQSSLFAARRTHDALSELEEMMRIGEDIPELFLIASIVIGSLPEVQDARTVDVMLDYIDIAKNVSGGERTIDMRFLCLPWAVASIATAVECSTNVVGLFAYMQAAKDQRKKALVSVATSVAFTAMAAGSVKSYRQAEGGVRVLHGASAGLSGVSAALAARDAARANQHAASAGALARQMLERASTLLVNFPVMYDHLCAFSAAEDSNVSLILERSKKQSQEGIAPALMKVEEYIDASFHALSAIKYSGVKELKEKALSGRGQFDFPRLAFAIFQNKDFGRADTFLRKANAIEAIDEVIKGIPVEKISSKQSFTRWTVGVTTFAFTMFISPFLEGAEYLIFSIPAVWYGMMYLTINHEFFCTDWLIKLRSLGKAALNVQA